MKESDSENMMVKKAIARITAIIGACIVIACLAGSIYHLHDDQNLYYCIAACGGLLVFGCAMEWLDIQSGNNSENNR